MTDKRQKRAGIYAAGDGSWRISVGAGRDPVTGEYVRIRETVVGSKRDAIRRRDDLRVDAARGLVIRADRTTVADYLERWITHREQLGKLRAKTAYVYRGHVRRHVTPRIGGMRLSDVRPVHVQGVLDECLAAGLSPRTVVQAHRIMGVAFRQAVRRARGRRWTTVDDGGISHRHIAIRSPTTTGRLWPRSLAR